MKGVAVFLFAAASVNASAQKYQGGIVDKTVAVVGNEMIMISDIESEVQMMQYNYGMQSDRKARCEMLESMIHNPRPTRAEISDVANAVYDGSSAVMLSGETAAGKYPVEAVKNMAEIAEYTEKHIDYKRWFVTTEYKIRNNLDAISHATCGVAIDIKAKTIAVCSLSGMTVRMVSRFRCPIDILGVTTDEKAWRKLALSWGVTPVMSEVFQSLDVLFYAAGKLAKSTFDLEKGDPIVITGGITNGSSGNTNLIKVDVI